MQKNIYIFSRLLDKLTQNCVFSVNKKVVKQADGCPIGGAISVITSDINMNRFEKERVMTLKPKFYKRYVDGTITKIKKNIGIDKLIRSTNSHHPNIKLTVETNPTIFLDRVFSKNLDGSVTTNVFRKPGKLQTF